MLKNKNQLEIPALRQKVELLVEGQPDQHNSSKQPELETLPQKTKTKFLCSNLLLNFIHLFTKSH